MTKLSAKEQYKYAIIKEYVDGKISRNRAAIKLELDVATISRLKDKFIIHGKGAFKHKNKHNNHAIRTDSKIEESIVKLYKEEFYDFNFTHFYQYIDYSGDLDEIVKDDSLPSYRTVFRILNRNSIISPQANKPKQKHKQHPVRPRRRNFGELVLVQLDASVHDWFNNEVKATLHLAIDDATSKITRCTLLETRNY
jgi:hypothetical protein